MSAPTHAGHGSEDYARQALIDLCLLFAPVGLNQGKSGNASLRWHRGAEDGMLITPSGIAYPHTTVDDIAWVPFAQPPVAAAVGPLRATVAATLTRAAPVPTPGAGTAAMSAGRAQAAPVLEPPARFDGPRAPSSEWRIHLDLYRARVEAGAIVHVHSPFATSLACLPAIQRDGIPAFHYMVAVAGGTDIRCTRYATFGTQALSEAALDALRGRRACLLANHGQIAIGADLEQALALALEVETLARQYWQALQPGEPALLDAAEMARVMRAFEHYGR